MSKWRYVTRSLGRSGLATKTTPFSNPNPSNVECAMIVGIGIDLLQRRRLERELRTRTWNAHDGVFTAEEIRSCAGVKDKISRLASCFAAKEATLKALGGEVEDLGMFREVEVRYGPSREPSIVLHGRTRSMAQRLGVRHVWVSTASAMKHAGAMVVLES